MSARHARHGLLLPLVLALAPCYAAPVRVSDGGLVKTPGTGDRAGLEQVSQGFVFANGVVRYQISYHAYWDPAGEGVKQDPEGYLGMPVPTACNWYAGGFLALRCNGLDLGNARPSGLRVVEQGTRGLAEVFWKTPEGQVRLRFLQEAGADYLAVEIATQPAREARSLDLSLRCFPSYFTSWNHRDGWRQAVGPATVTEQGKDAVLDPSRDGWLLYQDTVFDRAKNATDSQGPCAALWLPEQLRSASVQVTNYPVTTALAMKPEVRSVRLAFWDFAGKTNVQALARMKSGAGEVAARLRQLDFRDSQVASFDAAEEQAILQGLLARTPNPDRWIKLLTPLSAEISRGLVSYSGKDLAAEQTVSEALAKYREALWDLRFEALLSD